MPLSRAELNEKIEQAKLLSELTVNPAWQLICQQVNKRLDWISRKIMSPELDHESTQMLRFQADVLRWLLGATSLASPEQFAKWEEDLAFQEKRDSMRKQRGLPPLGQPTEPS